MFVTLRCAFLAIAFSFESRRGTRSGGKTASCTWCASNHRPVLRSLGLFENADSVGRNPFPFSFKVCSALVLLAKWVVPSAPLRPKNRFRNAAESIVHHCLEADWIADHSVDHFEQITVSRSWWAARYAETFAASPHGVWPSNGLMNTRH